MDAGFRQEFPKLPCDEPLLRQINAHGPRNISCIFALSTHTLYLTLVIFRFGSESCCNRSLRNIFLSIDR
jgi:hypothetical protein